MSDSISKSFVWQYFVKNKNEESAKCMKCNNTLKCRGWSTSGLLRHLQIKHNLSKATQASSSGLESTETSKRKIDSDNETTSTSQQKKPLLSYFFQEKRESLEEIVSKLVCVDGFTVNAITNSNFIRKSLREKGYSFPTNPSDVMKLIYKQYDLIKAQVKNEISSKLNSGLRCSLTLDEYTSLKNRRYLNMNVHFNEGKYFNLGMLRIIGSFSAESCVKAVEAKLKEFGIIIEKHVVACVTDGASMMVKFGKIMSCEYQLCYAHAIHLAVCDVLYKNTEDLVESTFEISHEEDFDESEDLTEDLDTALEFEHDITADTTFQIAYPERNSTANINETIKKIRDIVKLFRKSPLKNDILQGYVKAEFGSEKMLCLDTKTRWNSLLEMLDRFLEIKSAISKALIDIKQQDVLDNIEFETLNAIVASLKPVKIGLEKLCSRDSTLLTAEGVFSFIFNEIKQQNSEFSKNLKRSLVQRINERRNVNLVALMHYLNFGRKYDTAATIDEDLSLFPSKQSVIKQAKSMMTKLFREEDESMSNSSQSEEESTETLEDKSLTLDEKLKKAIQSKTKVLLRCSSNKDSTFSKIIKQELQLFDSTENQSSIIMKLSEALKTIPPTSVEAERAFSAAGMFITKLRTRLSDKSINCLCFLKSYLKNN